MSSTTDTKLRERARALIFSHRTLDYVIDSATEEQKVFFLQCLDQELEVRKENKHARLIKAARFPAPKGFQDYEWDHLKIPPSISKEELVSATFIQKAHDLVLYGPVGTGKTHIQ